MITVDVSKTIAELTDKLGKLAYSQMPYAASVALNKTAEDIQRAEVREMRDVFDRPTPYTLSSVYVKRSTKATLQATVGLKDFSGKGTPATKFLKSQITGGGRRLKKFERALRVAGHLPEDYRAVPGSGARLDQYGNIMPSQITQILSYFRAFPEMGYRANMTDKRRRALAKGSKRIQGFAYFIGRPGDRLPLGVWQRFGFSRGSAIRPVLIFVRQAQYQALFDFEYVAQSTAQRAFPAHFEAALADAMRTAR
jgi:hypothetical protein